MSMKGHTHKNTAMIKVLSLLLSLLLLTPAGAYAAVSQAAESSQAVADAGATESGDNGAAGSSAEEGGGVPDETGSPSSESSPGAGECTCPEDLHPEAPWQHLPGCPLYQAPEAAAPGDTAGDEESADPGNEGEAAPEGEDAAAPTDPAAADETALGYSDGSVTGVATPTSPPPAVPEGGVDIKTYFPDGESPTIIDNSDGNGMAVQFFDTQGNEILPPQTPTAQSTIRFAFQLAIPESIRYSVKADDYYVIQLPPEIKINRGLSNTPLINPDTGTAFAAFTVDTDGRITIVFTEAVQDYGLSNLRGGLYFSGGLNQNIIDKPGEYDVVIPDESDLPPVHIVLRPAAGASVDKTGNLDQEYNPTSVTWYVDVNKPLSTLTGAVVTDTLPEGLSFVSVEVFPVTVDLNGNVSAVSDTPADNATVDPDGAVRFNGPIDSAYRVVYHTAIDPAVTPTSGGTKSFTNQAAFITNEAGELTAQATVAARFGRIIEKTGNGYDPAGQVIHWGINYNYGEGKIPQSDAWINDVINTPGVVIDPATLDVRRVTFTSNHTPVRDPSPLAEGADYNVAYDTAANSMRIEFLHDVEYAVNVAYDAKVTGFLDKDAPVRNTASTAGNRSSYNTVNLKQQGLVKKVSKVDYARKTVTWQIDVNINRYRVRDLQLLDILEMQAYQQLLSNTVTLRDMTDNVDLSQVSGPDSDGYILTFPEGDDDHSEGFYIDFAGKYKDTDHAFRILYTTGYDVFYEGEAGGVIQNLIMANWKDENGGPHENEATATFKPNQQTVNNGEKSGSYNAATKEITWTVTMNYTRSILKNAYLLDNISEGQHFVPGSVKIYHYTVNPGGSYRRGAELSAAEYAGVTITPPSDGGERALRVDFPDGNGMYIVEFRTSVAGEFIGGTFRNVASFNNDATPDIDLVAEVSTKHKGAMAEKTGGQQDDGYVWWTITVNPDQSALDNLTVTDIMSAGQIADLDSLVIHGVTVDSAGALSVNPGVTLREGADYTVSYAQNPANKNQWELAVKFLHTIDLAYMITFRSSLYVDSTRPVTTMEVTNQVHISGERDEEHTYDTTGRTVVDVNTGGGIFKGERIRFVVNKTDWNGVPLGGALFQLYNASGLKVGEPVRTGENGEAVFENIVSGHYTLKELEAPPGYGIPPDLARGVILNLTKDYGTYTAVNEPTLVTFTKTGVKQDGEKIPLTGARFALEVVGADGSWSPYGEDTYVSGPDGLVEIRGLPYGQYRLVESQPPEGFLLGDPVEFTVGAGQGNRIELGEITNSGFYGRLRIIKTDLSRFNHLEGATYTLYDGSGGTVADNIVTGPGGEATVDNLSEGHYTLVETKGPDGYDIDHMEHEFDIAYDMRAIQVVTQNLADDILPETSPPGGTSSSTPPESPSSSTPPPGGTSSSMPPEGPSSSTPPPGGISSSTPPPEGSSSSAPPPGGTSSSMPPEGPSSSTPPPGGTSSGTPPGGSVSRTPPDDDPSPSRTPPDSPAGGTSRPDSHTHITPVSASPLSIFLPSDAPYTGDEGNTAAVALLIVSIMFVIGGGSLFLLWIRSRRRAEQAAGVKEAAAIGGRRNDDK